jgi:hypothetical protein
LHVKGFARPPEKPVRPKTRPAENLHVTPPAEKRGRIPFKVDPRLSGDAFKVHRLFRPRQFPWARSAASREKQEKDEPLHRPAVRTLSPSLARCFPDTMTSS